MFVPLFESREYVIIFCFFVKVVDWWTGCVIIFTTLLNDSTEEVINESCSVS